MPPQNTGAWGRGGVRGIPAVLPDTPAARHTEGWLLQHCLHGRLWAASKRATAGCAAQAPATAEDRARPESVQDRTEMPSSACAVPGGLWLTSWEMGTRPVGPPPATFLQQQAGRREPQCRANRSPSAWVRWSWREGFLGEVTGNIRGTAYAKAQNWESSGACTGRSGAEPVRSSEALCRVWTWPCGYHPGTDKVLFQRLPQRSGTCFSAPV